MGLLKGIMRIVLLFFILTSLSSAFSQNVKDTSIILLNDFYKGDGVILQNKYFPPFEISDFKSHYHPINSEIEDAEHIIKEQWNKLSYNEKYFRYKKLKYWNRQYFCYKTKNDEIIIITILLNFKNKRKAKKYFPNWKSELIVGFGSFYEKNTLMIKINITKRTITM